MHIVKNMTSTQRAIRLLLAVASIGWVWAAGLEQGLTWLLSLGLVTLGMSGVVGWCPLCAMLGRCARQA